MGFFSKLFSSSENSESSSQGDDMKYCPQCGDEYRQDFDTCAHCQVDLVGDEFKQSENKARQEILNRRSMKITNDEKLVRIQKAPMKEIKHMAMVLAKSSIPSVLEGDALSLKGG